MKTGETIHQIGKKICYLTVEKIISENNCPLKLLIRCDCNRTKIIDSKKFSPKRMRACSKQCAHFQDSLKLINTKINYLQIEEIFQKDKKLIAKCICNCGKMKDIDLAKIKCQSVKSCGCLVSIKSGEQFRRLNAIQVGSKHPNWKDGRKRAREKEKDRNSPEGRAWRKSILHLYGKTCQVCNSTNRPEAHHVNSYELNPEQRHTLQNGICLCKRCHCLFHSIYGKNNNIEQLMEFKQKFLNKKLFLKIKNE